MSKLKEFSKSNKKNIIPLVALCTIVALISSAVSYAVYQKTDEIQFINAKVGNFDTSNSDIELAMTLDGIDIETPPNKNDGYYNIIVDCDHADGIWDKEKWGAVITNISSNRVKCNVNFEALDVLANKVEIGNYIKMTPTSTSYTIPTNLTGYTSNQTINPSELSLWRVIKKNDDGTVDVVSEYVSSTKVYLRGQVGWLNLVKTLNTIASQYMNSKYVSSTRHMGYSNQMETCTNLLSCPNNSGYGTDATLVNAIRALKGKLLNGQETSYWVANRGSYMYNQSLPAFHSVTYEPGTHSIVGSGWLFSTEPATMEYKSSVRPILILKANANISSGDGKSASTAYQFE